QHTGRCKARIVDQRRVVVTDPAGGVRRVGDNRLERLVIIVVRLEQRVAVGDAELGEVDVVQEHVDACQVVGRPVEFLAVETDAHVVLAQHLGELQQQRTGTTGRVVDLVDAGLADHGEPGQQVGHFLWGEVLATGLAGVSGVEAHEVFVGVAEHVDGTVPKGARRQAADGVQQLEEFLVSLRHRVAQAGAGDVNVLEQALDVVFALGAERGFLDGGENTLDEEVQLLLAEYSGVRVLLAQGSAPAGGTTPDVLEQVGGRHEKALLLHDGLADRLGLLITDLRVVEVNVTGLPLSLVDEVGEVLGDKPVEKHAEDVGLEIPPVDVAAEFVGGPPQSLLQLCFLCCSHHPGFSPALNTANRNESYFFSYRYTGEPEHGGQVLANIHSM